MPSKFISLLREEGITTARFNVSHDNGESTVDQDLVLRKNANGWTAEMAMAEFQDHDTATAAARKLADWFERLGAELKKLECDSINLNDL